MKRSVVMISILVCAGVLTGCRFSNMQSNDVPQKKHPQNVADKNHVTEKNTYHSNHVNPNENSQVREGTQKNRASAQEQKIGDSEELKKVTISVPYISGTGDVGCGVGIKFVPYQVPQTKGVLNAVYTKLFDRSQDIAPEYRNTVHAYESLTYDSVTLSDSVARVYLSGNMYGPDHCTLPELRALIDQAAFQFDTVDTVMVYLNGEIYDWCEKDVSDGETGCPAKQQLWIDKKEK